MNATAPKPDFFSHHNLEGVADTYFAFRGLLQEGDDVGECDVVIAPLPPNGASNWTAAAEADAEFISFMPRDAAEALRWCVRVRKITACSAGTTIVFWRDSGNGSLVMHQASGPPEDGHLAELVVARAIGTTPKELPKIEFPLVRREPPI